MSLIHSTCLVAGLASISRRGSTDSELRAPIELEVVTTLYVNRAGARSRSNCSADRSAFATAGDSSDERSECSANPCSGDCSRRLAGLFGNDSLIVDSDIFAVVAAHAFDVAVERPRSSVTQANAIEVNS